MSLTVSQCLSPFKTNFNRLFEIVLKTKLKPIHHSLLWHFIQYILSFVRWFARLMPPWIGRWERIEYSILSCKIKVVSKDQVWWLSCFCLKDNLVASRILPHGLDMGDQWFAKDKMSLKHFYLGWICFFRIFKKENYLFSLKLNHIPSHGFKSRSRKRPIHH